MKIYLECIYFVFLSFDILLSTSFFDCLCVETNSLPISEPL